MRVLVVDDEKPLADALAEGLSAQAYAVDVCYRGGEAKEYLLSVTYDCVLLDLGLPDLEGSDLLQVIRKTQAHTPVLVISGRTAVEEKVRTLDFGADDYLVKPISIRELSARVRALTRRKPNVPVLSYRFGKLEIDRSARMVMLAGERIYLTNKEFGLLEYLARNAGRAVTREMILESVWEQQFGVGSNVVDVCINGLRKKISDEITIETVRGVGYMLNHLKGDQA